MFDGDIICRSKHGNGSKFIFIVAISEQSNWKENIISNNRILNPDKKDYEKIEIIEAT